MFCKTRRILFFLTITIFAFANTSQARYLLVEVVGEPEIDDNLPRNIPESDDGSTTPELTITSSDRDGGTTTTPEINGEFKTSTPESTESEDDETTTGFTEWSSTGWTTTYSDLSGTYL